MLASFTSVFTARSSIRLPHLYHCVIQLPHLYYCVIQLPHLYHCAACLGHWHSKLTVLYGPAAASSPVSVTNNSSEQMNFQLSSRVHCIIWTLNTGWGCKNNCSDVLFVTDAGTSSGRWLSGLEPVRSDRAHLSALLEGEGSILVRSGACVRPCRVRQCRCLPIFSLLRTGRKVFKRV